MKNLGQQLGLERGPGFTVGFRRLPNALRTETISAAIVSTLFSITGPAFLYVNTALSLGFTNQQATSWLFGCYFFSGIISLVMALYYQQPIVGAACIPGATMLSSALQGATFEQAVGTYVGAGVLVLIIGLSGFASRLMKIVPLPIVMGMVAGCMMQYTISVVVGIQTEPLLCGVTFLGYLLIPRLWKQIPGMLGALITAVILLLVTGDLLPAAEEATFFLPITTKPAWNGPLFLSVALPLAILVVGAQNAQAIGVLKVEGYDAPVNSMTVISGIGSILAGFFGGHNANIAGPMTAICGSEDAGKDKSIRFGAAALNGIFSILFGLFASLVIAFARRIPTVLINMMAGLGLISVLMNALHSGFSSPCFRLGTFAAFLIGLCNLTLFNIGAAFWGLLIGCLISLLAEPTDFKKQD